MTVKNILIPWSFKQNKQRTPPGPDGHFGVPRSSSALESVADGVFTLNFLPPSMASQYSYVSTAHRSTSKVSR